jgi:hypothetical protein
MDPLNNVIGNNNIISYNYSRNLTGQGANSANFSSILSGTMSSLQSNSGTPTDDPSTWAEMAMIDPSTGKGYFTPVNANVEEALKDAVSKHIPGFEVDSVSDQKYISYADIRLTPVNLPNGQFSDITSSPGLQPLSTPLQKTNIVEIQPVKTNVSNQSIASTGLAQAQSTASLLNNILSNAEINGSDQYQQDASTLNTLIYDLLKTSNNQNSQDNITVLNKIL